MRAAATTLDADAPALMAALMIELYCSGATIIAVATIELAWEASAVTMAATESPTDMPAFMAFCITATNDKLESPISDLTSAFSANGNRQTISTNLVNSAFIIFSSVNIRRNNPFPHCT